jgi:hypothetical protein
LTPEYVVDGLTEISPSQWTRLRVGGCRCYTCRGCRRQREARLQADDARLSRAQSFHNIQLPPEPCERLAAEEAADLVDYSVICYSPDPLFPETSEAVSVTPVYAPDNDKSRGFLANHSDLLLASVEYSHVARCRMACVDHDRLRVCRCSDFIEVLISMPLD